MHTNIELREGEMFMKKITLLVTGAAVCFALSGCGGNDSAADGGRAVSLQDMAMDIRKESDILPGAVQGESLPKSTQEENSAGGAQGEIQPGGISGETGTITDERESSREFDT